MAQTQKPISGAFTFQDDFNVQPPIECYKSCQNCQKEVSSVYIVLSSKPLSKNELKSKTLATKSFRRKTNNLDDIMAKVDFTIY